MLWKYQKKIDKNAIINILLYNYAISTSTLNIIGINNKNNLYTLIIIKERLYWDILFTFSDFWKLKQINNINKTVLKNNNIINTYYAISLNVISKTKTIFRYMHGEILIKLNKLT